MDNDETQIPKELDRGILDLENTEYDYGHNVLHVKVIKPIDHIDINLTINQDDGTGDI